MPKKYVQYGNAANFASYGNKLYELKYAFESEAKAKAKVSSLRKEGNLARAKKILDHRSGKFHYGVYVYAK